MSRAQQREALAKKLGISASGKSLKELQMLAEAHYDAFGSGKAPKAAKAKAPAGNVVWAKDVASDVILIAAPADRIFDHVRKKMGIRSPFVVYAVSFDGDIISKGGGLAGGSGHIIGASSIEDAKKKAEAAWKKGEFGKAGDPMWAKTYNHRIGKGWYKNGVA